VRPAAGRETACLLARAFAFCKKEKSLRPPNEMLCRRAAFYPDHLLLITILLQIATLTSVRQHGRQQSTRTAGPFFNPNETGAQIQYTYSRPDTQAELLHWRQWPRGAIWFPAAMFRSLAAHASQRV
jgi:hypothetical protein